MLLCKILTALGFGAEEGGGDAAVKRQAEGFSNPMYQLANLFGQVGHSDITERALDWTKLKITEF